jgi:hypothetical protein
VKPGQRDKLEPVPHGRQFMLETRDGVSIEMELPACERRIDFPSHCGRLTAVSSPWDTPDTKIVNSLIAIFAIVTVCFGSAANLPSSAAQRLVADLMKGSPGRHFPLHVRRKPDSRSPACVRRPETKS